MSLSDEKQRLLEMRLTGKAPRQTAPARRVITPRPADTIDGLSPGQRRMWYLHQANPSEPVYSVTSSFWVRGADFDPGRAERAANRVAARHPILRRVFQERDGVVAAIEAKSFSVILRRLEADGGQQSILDLARAEARNPFDLSSEPAFRLIHVSSPESERFFFMLVTHHLVLDNWSIGLFWKEFAAAYRADAAPRPVEKSDDRAEPTIEFADFACWQAKHLESGVRDAQLEYWRGQFADRPDPPEIPADFPGRQRSGNPGALEFRIAPAETADRIRRLASGEDASLFTVLMLTSMILLNRYTGRDDIVIGAPIANRRFPELTELLGFFLGTVAIRADLSGNPTVREALGRVRTAVLGGMSNQDVPFDEVVHAIHPDRHPGRNPLFSAMLVYQSAEEARPRVDIPGLQFEPVHVETGTARFDLTLFFTDHADGLEILVEFRTDMFRRETVRRMLTHVETLLAEVARSPDARLSDLQMIPDPERAEILRLGRNELPAADIANTVPVTESIDRFARSTPRAPALVSIGASVTYSDLHERSAAVAAALRRIGIVPGSAVGLFLERSAGAVTGLLGILRAGGMYVPIDPGYPESRIQQILAHADCRAVITTKETRGRLGDPACPVLEIDGLTDGPGDFDAFAIEMSQPAYAIFTSGSTGKPKGVRVRHANLAFSNTARSLYYDGRPERFLLIPSLAFDSSVAGTFWTLTAGGTLVLMPQDLEQDIDRLAALIRDQSITHLLCLPSLWEAVLRYADPASLRSLRAVIVAGEPCPTSLAASHADRLPDAALFNEYGPTEATVWCTVHPVAGIDDPVPIGRPIPGASLYLLDDHKRLVPIGIPGEIHIGGRGVADGYLRDAETTAERFLPDPFSAEPGARMYRTGDLARMLPDGRLLFLGRKDGQIKIRGYRVELGEIEATLRRHPNVRDAAVAAVADDISDRIEAHLNRLDPTVADQILAAIESTETESLTETQTRTR